MSDYIARIKPSAGQSAEARHLVGKKVEILPDTAKPIEAINDVQFKVVPVDSVSQPRGDIRICAKHLEPMSEQARQILNTKT
jgi:hypothetical protein